MMFAAASHGKQGRGPIMFLPAGFLLLALLAGLLAWQPGTAAPLVFEGVTFYTDRESFALAWSALPVEDFEEGQVKDGDRQPCNSPVYQGSNDDCFAPGDILPGLALRDQPLDPIGMLLLGADPIKGYSHMVGPATGGDALEIIFEGPQVYALGMDLWTLRETGLQIRLRAFGPGDTVLVDEDVAVPPTGVFWGLATEVRIARLYIEAEGNIFADNIAFGGQTLTCNGPAVGFANGIPADWHVNDNTGEGSVVWSDLVTCGEAGNWTGGSGDVACASSDEHGGNRGLYDTALESPSFDMSGYNVVLLSYKLNFQKQDDGDQLLVQASSDGGKSWTGVRFYPESNGGNHDLPGANDAFSIARFAGESDVRLRFRYYDDTGPKDSPNQYAQIDDVSLFCAAAPFVDLVKTVGTTPGACAETQAIEVSAGTEVTYCYSVTNTGLVTATTHNLTDSHLGNLLTNFVYDLGPGETFTYTVSAVITQTTTNEAVWLASDGNFEPADVDSATVTVPAMAYDSCLGFESGMLPGYVLTATTSSGASNGRVVVSDAFPRSGIYALNLDTDCTSCSPKTFQSATIVADLAGQTDVNLDFWVHGHGDEIDVWDAVDISDDGGETWATIFALQNFPRRYENVVIDLDQAAADAGMILSDGFQIRFGSFDNFPIPSDGFSLDDICLIPTQPKVAFETLVGLDADVCGPWSNLDVPAGTEVHTCYRTENVGLLSLSRHTLESSLDGLVYDGESVVLAPGSTEWVSATSSIAANTAISATWTSFNPGPTDVVSVQGNASVNVAALPLMNLSPAAINQNQQADSVGQATFNVNNPGGAPLTWSLRDDVTAYIFSLLTPGNHRFDSFGLSQPADANLVVGGLLPVFETADFSRDDYHTMFVIESANQVVYALNTQTGDLRVYNRARLTGDHNYWLGLSSRPDASDFYGLAAFSPNFSSLTALQGLYTLDVSSGEVTKLANVVPPGGTCCLSDLSVSPGGVIYAVHTPSNGDSHLVTINPSNGAVTVVGSLGFPARLPTGLDFDDASGILYLAARNQDTNQSELRTVELGSGASTLIGAFPERVDLLAVANSADDCQPGPLPAWAELGAVDGVVSAGGSQPVSVTFDSTGLTEGQYQGQLCLSGDGFAGRPMVMPLILNVRDRFFNYLPLIIGPP